MSQLRFLSPDLARDDLGFAPLARSPLERLLRAAGATFEERHGWAVAASVPGEEERLARVGLADLSHLAKFEVRGGGGPMDGVEDAVWHGIRPDRSLVLAPTGRAGWLRDRLERAVPLVLDQTASYAILAVVGPEAPAAMRRVTHLHHFPASGDVAHVAGHVLVRDGGFWVVVPQEYGHYVLEVALDAAGAFGGGLVGVDALDRARA